MLPSFWIVQVRESLDTELMVAQILPISKNTRFLHRLKWSWDLLDQSGRELEAILD